MKDIYRTIETNRRRLDTMPSAYKLTATDAWEIADHAGVEFTAQVMDILNTAYEYGLIKGQRYIKNGQKGTK